MDKAAAEAGLYHSELADRDYPRVQILTIRELLEGKRPLLPLLVMPTYQQAERVQASPGQMEAFG
jgi:site-specific DNA-methyltransferase (adenine-specific)